MKEKYIQLRVTADNGPNDCKTLKQYINKKGAFMYKDGEILGTYGDTDLINASFEPLKGFLEGRKYSATLKKIGKIEEIDTFHSFFWGTWETEMLFEIDTEPEYGRHNRISNYEGRYRGTFMGNRNYS